MPTAPAYIEDKQGQGRRFELASKGSWRIGRGPNNDIVVDAAIVSRNHALIQAAGRGAYYLLDLGSQNGTFANGRPVTSPVQLTEADEITIGLRTFAFHLNRAAAASSSSAISSRATAVQLAVRVMTVLVVDFRNLARITREIDSADLARMMACYFRECGRVLREREVWAQKYIGGAVTAIWLHEADLGRDRTVLAAVDSLRRIEGIAAILEQRFSLSQPVCISAGMSTGIAALGNPGGGAPADYKALGDTVIQAFRLERVAREIDFDVALSAECAAELQRLTACNCLNARLATLKGDSDPRTIYGADLRALENAAVGWRPGFVTA